MTPVIMTSFLGSKAPRERKVCIAKWHRFWTGPCAPLFAPSNPKAQDWKASFRADMDQRFPTAQSLEAYLVKLCTQYPSPILCCYEQNPLDCHRSVLAEIINETLGWRVTEWTPPAPRAIYLSLL